MLLLCRPRTQLTSPAPYAVLASGILSDAAAASTLGYSFSVVPTCSNFSMRFSPNSNNSSAGTDRQTKHKELGDVTVQLTSQLTPKGSCDTPTASSQASPDKTCPRNRQLNSRPSVETVAPLSLLPSKLPVVRYAQIPCTGRPCWHPVCSPATSPCLSMHARISAALSQWL